jgi:hypothetical protein
MEVHHIVPNLPQAIRLSHKYASVESFPTLSPARQIFEYPHVLTEREVCNAPCTLLPRAAFHVWPVTPNGGTWSRGAFQGLLLVRPDQEADLDCACREGQR